jgi:hypothetical protein
VFPKFLLEQLEQGGKVFVIFCKCRGCEICLEGMVGGGSALGEQGWTGNKGFGEWEGDWRRHGCGM